MTKKAFELINKLSNFLIHVKTELYYNLKATLKPQLSKEMKKKN